MNLKTGIQLLLLLAVLFSGSTWAETKSEVWPEVNVYSKLNEQFRLRFASGITRSQEFQNKTDGFLEVDLDIGIKRAFKRKAIFRDVERNKLFTLRVGYSYVSSFAEEGSNENRAILEVTNRFKVSGDLHLNDRNRLDFRWIDDDNSVRYRNRLKLEREFSLKNFHFNTYAHTEFYYDGRSDSWNRYEYAAGAEFPVFKRTILEFYYMHQDNKSSGSTDVNALGIVWQFFVGN